MPNGSVRILVGDAIRRLRELPDQSIHCCITSPPYWGLRSYKGDPGMIGMESTFEEHLDNLEGVFREVYRVLRDDGTLWLNYGDRYSNAGTRQAGRGSIENPGQMVVYQPRAKGFKNKDLMLMPFEVAVMLRRDVGWYIRSEIIWSKSNPMPESVVDRPTASHEKIWLMTKRPRYFYDIDAVRNERPANSIARDSRAQHTVAHVPPGSVPHSGKAVAPREHGELHPQLRRAYELAEQHGLTDDHIAAIRATGISDADYGTQQLGLGKNTEETQRLAAEAKEALGSYYREFIAEAKGANLRNVWTLPTSPYPDAHFATFPPDLVVNPIKAGTSEHGVCGACGAPWRRLTETPQMPEELDERDIGAKMEYHRRNMPGGQKQADWREQNPTETVGWEPGCECNEERIPATVLDPFGGAGTVAVVAQNLGRSAVLVEISPEYAEMAAKRCRANMGMFADVEVVIPVPC